MARKMRKEILIDKEVLVILAEAISLREVGARARLQWPGRG